MGQAPQAEVVAVGCKRQGKGAAGPVLPSSIRLEVQNNRKCSVGGATSLRRRLKSIKGLLCRTRRTAAHLSARSVRRLSAPSPCGSLRPCTQHTERKQEEVYHVSTLCVSISISSKTKTAALVRGSGPDAPTLLACCAPAAAPTNLDCHHAHKGSTCLSLLILCCGRATYHPPCQRVVRGGPAP